MTTLERRSAVTETKTLCLVPHRFSMYLHPPLFFDVDFGNTRRMRIWTLSMNREHAFIFGKQHRSRAPYGTNWRKG
jgi:hypothetical protein